MVRLNFFGFRINPKNPNGAWTLTTVVGRPMDTFCFLVWWPSNTARLVRCRCSLLWFGLCCSLLRCNVPPELWLWLRLRLWLQIYKARPIPTIIAPPPRVVVVVVDIPGLTRSHNYCPPTVPPPLDWCCRCCCDSAPRPVSSGLCIFVDCCCCCSCCSMVVIDNVLG